MTPQRADFRVRADRVNLDTARRVNDPPRRLTSLLPHQDGIGPGRFEVESIVERLDTDDLCRPGGEGGSLGAEGPDDVDNDGDPFAVVGVVIQRVEFDEPNLHWAPWPTRSSRSNEMAPIVRRSFWFCRRRTVHGTTPPSPTSTRSPSWSTQILKHRFE